MSRTTRLVLGGAGVGAAAVAWAAARSRPELPDAPPPLPPPGLPEGRLVAVPDRGELFFRDTGAAQHTPGDAPTILLLHGWMFPSDLNWFPSYEPLSALGRVIALDHRGHGHGIRPSKPFRLADAADDAAALVRHLGTGPAVVVGYSMGGPIAQILAARHPELVRGVVLCATSDTFSQTARDRALWRTMGVLQLILRLLPRHTVERLVRAQALGRLPMRITTLLKDDTPPEIVALIPWFLGELARGTAEDIAEAGRELGRYDGTGFVGQIAAPAVAIITTRDELVPVERQRRMAARIPACEVIELPLDHDAAVSGAHSFVPALVKAVNTVLDAS